MTLKKIEVDADLLLEVLKDGLDAQNMMIFMYEEYEKTGRPYSVKTSGYKNAILRKAKIAQMLETMKEIQ